MGPTLQSNFALAEMHHLLRPTPLGHPVHPWCPLLSWPRCLLTSRSGDSGAQPQTRVTVFFCFSVFVYVALPVFLTHCLPLHKKIKNKIKKRTHTRTHARTHARRSDGIWKIRHTNRHLLLWPSRSLHADSKVPSQLEST